MGVDDVESRVTLLQRVWILDDEFLKIQKESQD